MAHDSPNLGIIDGSVFVTSGGVNPTSTIAALALRAAEHLIENRASIPRSERRRTFAGGATITTRVSAAGGPTAATSTVKLPSAGVTPSIRRRINAVAASLIPAGDGMPSAAEVDVAGKLLDRVAALLPDLTGTLCRIFDGDVEDPEEWLGELSATDPGSYRSVLLAIAASYYLDTEVRRRIGYPGQSSTPVRANELPQYVSEDLLEQVIAHWEGNSDALDA
jgi:hypothetical protein